MSLQGVYYIITIIIIISTVTKNSRHYCVLTVHPDTREPAEGFVSSTALKALERIVCSGILLRNHFT